MARENVDTAADAHDEGHFQRMSVGVEKALLARCRHADELDIGDDEIRQAPSFRADKDFDWGDRSKEAALHRYYGLPPDWGGF